MAPTNAEVITAVIIITALAVAAVWLAAALISDTVATPRPLRVTVPRTPYPQYIRPLRREKANSPRHIRRRNK